MRPDLTRDIVRLTGEHLSLVGISMAIAILLGVPLGIRSGAASGVAAVAVGSIERCADHPQPGPVWVSDSRFRCSGELANAL